MEIKICSKREVRKWLGSSKPTLGMVTEEEVRSRLEQDLRTLKLDNSLQGNLIQRILKLEGLTQSKINKLVVYVSTRASCSHEELKQQITPRVILKHEKWLQEAGLSGQSTLGMKDALPSLLHLLLTNNDNQKEAPRVATAQEISEFLENKLSQFPQGELDCITDLSDLPWMDDLLASGENVASSSTQYDTVTSDNFAAVHSLSKSTSDIPLQTPVQEGDLTIDDNAYEPVTTTASKVDEQYQNTTHENSIPNMTINLEGDVDFLEVSPRYVKRPLAAGPD